MAPTGLKLGLINNQVISVGDDQRRHDGTFLFLAFLHFFLPHLPELLDLLLCQIKVSRTNKWSIIIIIIKYLFLLRKMFYDCRMVWQLQLGGLLCGAAVFCFLLPLWLRQRPLWTPINTPELFAAYIFSLVWGKCFPQGAYIITCEITPSARPLTSGMDSITMTSTGLLSAEETQRKHGLLFSSSSTFSALKTQSSASVIHRWWLQNKST